MDINELYTPKNIVLSYNETNKIECYLRKIAFVTKPHTELTVSVSLLKQIIETVTLGDGKKSTRIKGQDLGVSDIEPGVFDIEDEFTSKQIKKYDSKSMSKALNFLTQKLQNTADSLGQLCNTLCCKALAGNYKHKATGTGDFKYEYKFGTPIKFTPKKITATSTVLELSKQTDSLIKKMLTPMTSKEDIRVLCSEDFYEIVCKIASVEGNSAFVEKITEPGVKINGYYYINDQGTYIDADQKTYDAVPAKGCIVINISQKSQMLLCDLGLDAIPSKVENASVVTVDGLPFTIAYEYKKAGLLITSYSLAAPIAVPRLSHIVHGLDLVA